MYRLPLCGIIILVALSTLQANNRWDKTKFFEERLQRIPLPTRLTDDPPPQVPIAVAEWEPSTGVLIDYPLGIPIDLVISMAEVCDIWSVVQDAFHEQAAIAEYATAGIDTSKCHFIHTGSTTAPWTRDYGPWYIFDGDGELGIIDNDYTWGSDQVPQILGDSLGIPVYATGITTEGGNYMTDGMGRAIVTRWIHLENTNLRKDQIDRMMTAYLGFEDHMVRPAQPSYFHIDTFAKLLDPGRILVIQPDPPDPTIELNVEYWSTVMSGYGRPYEIIRIQGRGYSNTLILNKKVLVPLFNSYLDSAALATFQQAMPGYAVEGYPWYEFSFGDALHCRTHEMADPGMLRIVHVPIHDRENDGGDYSVECSVYAYSNLPLVPGTPEIYWQVEGGSCGSVSMTQISEEKYQGYIPQQPDGVSIEYYIYAEDESGRSENHPYIGQGNPHRFYVGPDSEPPQVEFDPPASLTAAQWPYHFTAYVLDNRWISNVTLEYSISGIAQNDVWMPLRDHYAVYYTGTPQGIVQPGDVVELRIKAVDTSLNQNTTYSDWHTITIASYTEADVDPLWTTVSPNPFNPSTIIAFELRAAEKVNLTVFDVSGRKVADLVNGWREAGRHEVTFDASRLVSGMYFYRLETDESTAHGKMLLVK